MAPMNNAPVVVQRVAQLPLVEAGTQQACAIYQKAKESHRLINFGLSMAEGTFWFAVEKAKPIYKALDPQISVVDKIATQKLEDFEHKYPVIAKSTGEIFAESKRFIEAHPTLDKGYNMVVGLKNFGIEKAQTTKASYEGLKSTGQGVINGALDLSEKVVDKYVVASTSSGGAAEEKDEQAAVVARVVRIASKAKKGVKTRVFQLYGKFATDEHFQPATLVNFTTARAQWMNEQRAKMQEHATKIWVATKEQAGVARQHPEATMVHLIRGVSSLSDTAIAQFLLVSSRFLPALALKPLSLTSSAVHSFNESIGQAEHLAQIRDEIVVQTREKFTDVEDFLSRVLDLAANSPPFAYLLVTFKGSRWTNGAARRDDFARIADNIEQ